MVQRNHMNLRILRAKDRIVEHFNSSHWQDIGLLTDSANLINRHPRLLRSLGFGDEDYEGHVTTVLQSIASDDLSKFEEIESYIDVRFGDDSTYVSSEKSEVRLTFCPSVFALRQIEPRTDLVSVMMPFQAGFTPVIKAIKASCAANSLDCLRADDIWDETTVIQEIFNLILQSAIVVCDFTGKNANVMYEAGIAHTLGKEVVPITQSMDDVPFDLRHHRIFKYLPNREGLAELEKELGKRLVTIIQKQRNQG